MGRLLKHRAKDNKWRLWTTISDGWLTEWLTEDEMKAELAYDFQQDYKKKVIESYWTFPHGYYDKDTQKMINNHDAVVEFHEWHLKALKSDNYDEQIEEMFNKLTKEPES